MLFKNRKRVVLDRGPSWPDYDKAEPFMVRYYPLFRKRPKWFPVNPPCLIASNAFCD